MGKNDVKPDGEKPKKRGPKPTFLSDEQRKEFLGLIKDGFGIHLAADQMGITWERVNNTRKQYPRFGKQIERAKAALKERLIALRTSHALSGDGRALEYTITRLDSAANFERNMKIKRMEVEIKRLLAERAVGGADGTDGAFDVRFLSQIAARMIETANADPATEEEPTEPE